MGPLALWFVACSGLNHDCVELRNCRGPEAIIEGRPRDDWWENGGTGPSEWPGGFEPGGAGFDLAGAPDQAAGAPSAAEAAGAGQAAGAAGTAGAAGSTDSVDSPLEPPRVVGVSPIDGARGISNDIRIAIAFSQAMDRAATEAAYHSSDLPRAALSFSWDEGQRVLTLTPRAPLPYGTGAVSLSYHYGFDGTARDLHGRALPAVEFSFRTLRQVALELWPDSERTGNWTDRQDEGIHNCLRHPQAPYEPTVCVGDDPQNVRYWGFLSFDLSAIPAQATQIASARLLALANVYGTPEALGKNCLEHVEFDTLGEAALNAAPSAVLGLFFNAAGLATGSPIALNVDLSAAIAEDYENRIALQHRSQYRIGFAQGSANSRWDDVELPTNGIRLAISYLVP